MGKINVDYRDMMDDINYEVSEGVLTEKDTIQILRAKTPVFENYCPIVDWYYDKYRMAEELETPLEEMYLPEEFSEEEWAEMKEGQELLKQQYAEDLNQLEAVTVKAVLTEMKQMQKLAGSR